MSDIISGLQHGKYAMVEDSMQASQSAFREIWDNLSSVNVNEHTETKNGLTFLSWAWAWQFMMERYPNMHVVWHGSDSTPDVYYYPGGSAMVGCTVSINGCSRKMWLPVMDHKSKAISQPDSRQISDAKMRCLVKCFALFGLGHYIYAGEDVPHDEQREGKEVDTLIDKVNRAGARVKTNGWPLEDDLAERVRDARAKRDVVELSKILASLNETITKNGGNSV